MAKRRVTAIVKIQLPAGKATPAPPVGTALGPHGVQTMEFVRQYNAATEDRVGQVIPVEITIFEDRRFSFVLNTPPTPFLIRQAIGVEKGSQLSGRETVGTITDAQLAEIAQIKMPDLNANDLEAAKAQIAGTARSMGVKVG
jgi:large subunit ribosomal protein L11